MSAALAALIFTSNARTNMTLEQHANLILRATRRRFDDVHVIFFDDEDEFEDFERFDDDTYRDEDATMLDDALD
jgi:hypothetical protein